MTVDNVLLITGGAGGMGLAAPRNWPIVGGCCLWTCARIYLTRRARP